jgi:hypothetical protein
MAHKTIIAAAIVSALAAGAGVAAYGVISSDTSKPSAVVSTQSPVAPSETGGATGSKSPGTVGPVQAVPGSNNNEYKAGPFDVKLVQGMTQAPGQDANGYAYGAEVQVTNISNTFTGAAQVGVEFSQNGQVLGSGDATDSTAQLAPGQSQEVWAPYTYSNTGYVSTQMVTLTYWSGNISNSNQLELAH